MKMSEQLTTAQQEVMTKYREYMKSQLSAIMTFECIHDWHHELPYSDGNAQLIIKKTKTFIESLDNKSRHFLKSLITDGIAVNLAKYFYKSPEHSDRNDARRAICRILVTENDYINNLPRFDSTGKVTSTKTVGTMFEEYKEYITGIILETPSCGTSSYSTVETMRDSWHFIIRKSADNRAHLMMHTGVFLKNYASDRGSRFMETLITEISGYLAPYFALIPNKDGNFSSVRNAGYVTREILNKKFGIRSENNQTKSQERQQKPRLSYPDLQKQANQFNHFKGQLGAASIEAFITRKK